MCGGTRGRELRGAQDEEVGEERGVKKYEKRQQQQQ